MDYTNRMVESVSIKARMSKAGKKFYTLGVKIDGVWYNKLTRPYSLESSLKKNQAYPIALSDRTYEVIEDGKVVTKTAKTFSVDVKALSAKI